MDGLVEIDGSLFEGGGQMIRSSLALATILGKQFRMHSIRKNRPNPGINNQLRSVFSAFTEKIPKVGDTEVYIYPKFNDPRVLKCSTAASCTLMLQCMVPTCTGIGYDEEIKIEGGSDVSRSPPLQSLRLGLIPLMKMMDVNLDITDVKKGYYPTGNGYVKFQVKKTQFIKPISFIKFAPPTKVQITYYVKQNKLPNSSKDFRKDIVKVLEQHFPQTKVKVDCKVEKVFRTKDNYGIGCMVYGEGAIWDVGTVGQKIKEQEILQKLNAYAEKKVCLDEHHQDQLLLLASLATGTSCLHVGQQLSLHTQSLLYVIKSFIPEFKYKHEGGILQIQGIGHKCIK